MNEDAHDYDDHYDYCLLPLWLAGCFSTHGSEDDPALRARFSEMPRPMPRPT